MLRSIKTEARSVYIFSVIGLFMFASCHQDSKIPLPDETELKEMMMDANKNLIHHESLLIDSFILRHGYEMNKSGTGMRYQILREGSGAKPHDGDLVAINYSSWMLDGTRVHSTKEKESEIIKLGQGSEIKGVEEVVLMMKTGDKMRLLIPSYLAYGIRGDGKLIPGSSPLLYELTLVAIKEENSEKKN